MELTEKTLTSALQWQGKILRLRLDTAELPDGTTATREVVEHPGGVGIVALTEDRQVLLVRQYRYPYGQVLTEIPAGKRERGEDPLLTAKRELEEETGYTAASFEPLGIVYPTPGFCDEVLYLYLATDLIETAPHPDEDEFLQVERQPLDTLVAEILAGRMADAKTQIALLKTYLLLQQKGE